MPTAVVLYSEGLDSLLAIKLMLEQSINLKIIQFTTPFFEQGDQALLIKKNYGIDLQQIDITTSFLNILKDPEYGYGKCLNPCIDCKILMLKEAKKLLLEFNASFIVTGDVVGQRPMTQQKNILRLIEKKSDLVGLILRPLSARLLPITIPEEKGYVDRSLLLDINGRSRKPQINLAKRFKIGEGDYKAPAGGCFLTNPNYAGRLKLLLQHCPEPDYIDLKFLSIGRHFYLSPNSRLIIGRDQEENQQLLSFKNKASLILQPKKVAGPTAILLGNNDEAISRLASSLMSKYIKLPEHSPGQVDKVEIQCLNQDLLPLNSILVTKSSG
ncbi:MAG: tRNA 4-thiouridine(8) synthase ThiI [bacterium]